MPANAALFCAPGEDRSPFDAALRAAFGPLMVAVGDRLPGGCGGLLIVGDRAYSRADTLPPVLTEALARDIPVLGTGWGMHAINLALGGGMPVAIAGHDAAAETDGAARGLPVRRPVFLSPGGKVASTIGGSGWVNVPCAHMHAIRQAQMAPGLLASAFANDGVIEAVERPGGHWVMGVEWRLYAPDGMPRGFDNLLMAFAERARGD